MSDGSKIKRLVELRKQNQQLEERLNKLRADHFELVVKCNRRENQLQNIRAVAQKAPEKLIGITNNLSKILEAIVPHKEPDTIIENTRPPAIEQQESISHYSPTTTNASKNKAHVVKPHMVNGHILYIPTINLTRVNADGASEAPNNSRSSMETNEDRSHNGSALQMINEETEMAEPSTSTGKRSGHSTVLSGTFQEVKIYLNSSNPSTSRNIQESPSGSGQRRTTVSTASSGITTRRKRDVNAK